jgi:hypothetical protein
MLFFSQHCRRRVKRVMILKRILSGVLRRKDVGGRGKSWAGALRIEFIELSRDESMGVEWLFLGWVRRSKQGEALRERLGGRIERWEAQR